MSHRRIGWSLGVIIAAASAAPAAMAQDRAGTQALLVVTGLIPDQRMGTVVGSAGDANGDSRADVLIGTDTTLSVHSGANGQFLYSIAAERPRDFDRATAFSIADLDGDARPEIIVAAPLADTQGQTDSGAVYVFSGSTGAQVRSIPGTRAGGRFGGSATLLGDLNGDRIPELVIGAPGEMANNLEEAGNVYVHSLSNGELLGSLSGTSLRGQYGSAVAALGDVNGDNRPDFAVGAPQVDVQGRPRAGIVAIISGADRGTLGTIPGQETDGRLGASLANAGDINKDGRADLIIGAPGREVGAVKGAGQVFVYSLAGGRILHLLPGATAADAFGTVVAGGSDVNGDGTPDIVVGAPLADVDGRADSGIVQVFSGEQGQLLLTFEGRDAGDQLGFSAAFAGDMNGDGRADVVVGSPFVDVLAARDVGLAAALGLAGL